MNMWIIAGIIVSLVIVAGITVMAIQNQTTNNSSTAPTTGCEKCNGKCTAESGCGQAACGATQGKTCGCKG